MTPSLTDWISAVASSISALVGLAVLAQLALTLKQLRLAREQQDSTILWNRLTATFSFFPDEVFLRREDAMVAALRPIGIDFFDRMATMPLTEAEVNTIVGDSNTYRTIRNYLNVLEDYALAVRVGVVDRDCGYAQMSAIVITRESFFRRLISHSRVKRGDDELYIELEQLANDWTSQTEVQRERRALALRQAEEIASQAWGRAQQLIAQGKGVKVKFPASQG